MSIASRTVLALALAVVLASAACGRPVSSSFPAESQPKMAAVRHWEILANEVADKVKKAVETNAELALTPIDVVRECAGPFCEVFRELLASQLVARGLQVASREEGVMALRYRIQVVSPEERAARAEAGSSVAMAGPGAGAEVAGTMEVVVTSELVYQNRFLVHHSGIYYADGDEAALYGRPLAPGKPGREGGRDVRITGE